MPRGYIKRVVIINPITLEPEAVFKSAGIARFYFKTYSNRIKLLCDNKGSDFGYNWMYADDWEKNNKDFLPGNKEAMIEL